MKSEKSETKSKQAEEANSLLAAIVESSDDAIIGKTLDGTILSWNRGAQNIYGYSADEVKGRSISILVPPDHPDEVPQFLERVKQGQCIEHYETVHMRKDGKQIDISLTISPIKDSTGKIIGASTIARDVTEHKRVEEELRRVHEELEIRVRERTAELEDANIELEAEIAERRTAKKKIEHLDSFPQLNPNPVIEIDANGTVIFSNAATAEVLKTLEIEDDARIFLPGDFKEIMKVLEQEKGIQTFYREVKVKDRIFAESIFVSKKLMVVRIYAHDITESKRAEEALRESEQKFMKLFQGNAAAIALTRLRDRHIIEVNERWQEVFGFSREEVIGGIVNKIKLWKHPEEQMRAIHDLETHGAFRNREYEFFRKNGEVWTGLMSSEVIQLQGEGFILTSLVDITDRKRAEEALRESEQRWATTLASIGDAVISTDVEGCVTFMNAEAEALTGWTLSEAMTKPVTEVFNIINEYTRQEADNPVTRVLQEGTIVGLANHTILVRKDGTEVPIDDSGAPIKDGGGKTMGVVLVFRDITERKRAETELRASRRFLEIANQHSEITPLLQEFVKETKNLTNCAAVGIRLLEKSGSIPYTAYVGFSQEFYEKESPLSIKTDNCMCINVVRDTTDPHLSFYTEYGSFYINGTTKFLATVSEEEKGKTRNVCNAVGYESVALIPIRSGTRIFGLLHLADYRENMVPLEMVKQLEQATPALGVSIQRILAEEALRESEQRWATTLASIGDAVISTDTEGRITFMNAEAEALTGWALAEASTKPVTEVFNIINEHTRREADNPVTRVLQEGIVVGLANHTILVRKDGTEVPIDDSGAPIRDGGGKTMGVVLVFRNITERKRAEDALRQSQQTFVDLVEGAPFGIYIVDSQFCISHMNAGSQTGAFQNVRPVIGRDFAEAMRILWPEPVAAEIIANFRHTLETGEPYYSPRFTNPRHDIEAMESYEWELHRMTLPSGEYGVVCYYFDSTKLRQAEQAVRESEQKYRNIVETAGEGIVLAKPEGNYYYVNQRMADMLGYSVDEILGKSSLDFTFDDWRPQVLQSRAELLKGDVLHGEFKFRRKDGSVVWSMYNASPIFNDEGEYVANLAMHTDITERKRAEDEIEELMASIKEEKDRLSALVKSIPDEVWFADAKHNIVLVNPAVLKAFGSVTFDKSEVESIAGNAEVYRPDGTARPVEEAPPLRALRGEEVRDQEEIVRIPASGELRVRQVNASPVMNAAGNIIGSVAVVRDITERKRAEKALQKAHDELEARVQERTAELSEANKTLLAEIEERRRAEQATQEAHKYAENIVETLHESLVVLDTELRVKIANQTFYKTFKVMPEETEGKLIYNLGNHQWDIPELRKLLEEIIPKDTQFYGFEVDHEFPDIRRKTMLLNARRLCQESNVADTILLAIEDITERKQAEEKIREQAALLDSAQEAVGVRSLEHRLIYWNKGAERLYGWTAEEAIGKNPVEFLFKDKEEPSQLISAKRIVLEKGEWIGELHQVTKDGREVIVESHWTLIYDSEGRRKSILVVNTDITEKKMFEAHLLRAQRMESIGILAGGIAHNLNNMLTPMMMSLHMLKGKFTDEQSQKLLAILEKNSQRSADLIKQVLSFSRGVEGERNPLQITHLISEIEKIAKETFPKNIEIRTDIPKDLFTISGDVTQLHQVIMNLCVNARDAMPDGGTLNISAENFFIDENYVKMHIEAKVGSYVAISVSDTGIGIPPKIVDRIFEPFFTTKEFGKGTGLGLSTALAIVKSHGGFINVYSEVGKGTTFRVYLPAIKTEMQDVEEHQLELLVGHGELVFVAEDEDSVREVTTSTLEKYGYNVLAANDGVDAVALYAQNMDKIKVILMDMMMPVMDGQASIRAIRKINPEVKIIAVSGLAEKEKLKNVADYTNAFLPKPYTAEKLLKIIHEVLSTK